MSAIIVTGTDTGIGKTVFSAGLVAALQGTYWKPVQSGQEAETDSQIVARLSGRPVLSEGYLLKLPASPHLSAEAEGVEIDLDTLALPQVNGVLVAEAAGGVMVPLNRRALFVDLFACWDAPVILCARTQLGTINHTLLSLQALRAVGCTVAGVVFIGKAEPEVEDTICQFGKVPHLGRLPLLSGLDKARSGAGQPVGQTVGQTGVGNDPTPTLTKAFAAHIDLNTIKKALDL